MTQIPAQSWAVIKALDLLGRRCIMADGAILPITNFSCGEEEMPDHHGAWTFVAGSDTYGWVSDLIEGLPIWTN